MFLWPTVIARAGFAPGCARHRPPVARHALASPEPIRFAGRVLLWLSILCGICVPSGCQQGVVYRPGKLPAGYEAVTNIGGKRLDIGRFARSATSSQRIFTGDVLNVSIATGLERDGAVTHPPVRVNEQGLIALPLIGAVQVAGLQLDDAERVIGQASIERGIYRTPNVSVTLAESRKNRITIVGAVDQPGVKQLRAADCDLFTALVAAGGMTDDATTVVEIRRPAPSDSQVTQVGYQASTPHPTIGPTGMAVQTPNAQPPNVRTMSETVDLSAPDIARHDLRLQDGTVVVVRPRPERTVQVIGLVKKPTELKMPRDRNMRLLDAIAQAGGLTMQLANKVHVIRHVSGQAEPILIETSIRSAKANGEANLLLAAGDVVSVEETPTTFTIDMLRSFIRFGFSASIPGF